MPSHGRIIDIRLERLPEPARFRTLDWVEDRICRKLREYDFRMGGPDHLVIELTTEKDAERPVELPPVESRVRSFRCSFDGAAFGAASQPEAEALLADAILRVVDVLAEPIAGGRATVGRVREELAKHGRDLEVEYLRHETRTHTLVLSHKLAAWRPGPLAPIRPRKRFEAWLDVVDKRTGARTKHMAFDFSTYEDIHSAAGSLSLKDGEVTIRPLRGYNFGVPIVVPMSGRVAG